MNLPRVSSLLLLVPTLVAGSVVGSQVLVPVVARAHGRNDALWASELRISNRGTVSRRFVVVDWIGTAGWRPQTMDVPAQATVSRGGADLFNASLPATGAVGLAICEVEPDLLVQAAVLSGVWSPGGVSYSCPPFDGGGPGDCGGSVGAGPIVEDLTFAAPRETITVPWLHTDFFRRTNLVLVNAEAVPTRVVVTITAQDGVTSSSAALTLPPRSYNQLDDLFSTAPWTDIREANLSTPFGGASASASVVSEGRLLALAFIISNENNSLTISVPHR